MREAILRGVARFACRRPWTIVGTAGLLAVLAAFAASTRLELNADTDDLIGSDRPYMKDYRRFIHEFGDLESIWVVVDSRGNRDAAERCVDALGRRLRALDELPAVHDGIFPDEALAIATRAMSDEELRAFSEVAAAFPALLHPAGARALLEDAAAKLQRLASAGLVMSDTRRRELGAAAVLEAELVVAAARPESERARRLGLFESPPREYLVSETGRLYFIEVRPDKDYGTLAVVERPLRAIRSVLDDVRPEHPEVEVGLTGKPVLQADEMRTTDADMTRASILAVILVGALFMGVLGGVRRPALAMLTLLLAIAWTFGLTTLTIGSLNLLSVVFTLILVGIGVDFGVHVLARYREERRVHPVEEAIERTLLAVGPGNVTGAATSAAAFFMALFTDFRGLQELGFIAGSGLLLCLSGMMVVLPALLALHDRNRPPPSPPPGWLTPALPSGRRWLIGVAVTTALASPLATRLGFEGNILELQAEGLESVTWEHRVLEDSASASWFGAAIADDEAELSRFAARARREPAIARSVSVHDVVKPATPERDELRASLHRALEDRVLVPDAGLLDEKTLVAARSALVRLADLAARRAPEESARLRMLAGDLASIDVVRDRDAIDANIARAARHLALMLDGDRRSLRDALPAALRHRMVAPTGRLLLAMQPAEDVWDLSRMAEFVAAMKRVDPEATGVPITHLESIADMKRGFARAALLALLAVIVLVSLDFRSPRLVALAVLPLGVGGIWLAEWMGLIGLAFNLANFFAVPILIGIGVDNGVHLVHRFREGTPDRHRFGATHRGIVLTSSTSLVGFGCLMLATHRGLRSLGLLMALGAATILAASLLVLPATLRRLDCDRIEEEDQT